MTSSSKNTWTLAPHQHQGPHKEVREDAHIHSPEKHNSNFKAEGILTFMGAPYCPPDRHRIREMGAKICFLGAPWDQGTIVRPAAHMVSVKHLHNISPTCSNLTLTF
jgi:hypothetical protein